MKRRETDREKLLAIKEQIERLGVLVDEMLQDESKAVLVDASHRESNKRCGREIEGFWVRPK